MGTFIAPFLVLSLSNGNGLKLNYKFDKLRGKGV